MSNTVPPSFYNSPQYAEPRADVLRRLSTLVVDHCNVRGDILYGYTIALEKACFNKTLQKCSEKNIFKSWDVSEFTIVYSQITFNLITLLEDQYDIFASFISRERSADDLLCIEAPDLRPDIYEAIRKEIDMRKMQKITNKITNMYTCSMCGGNECTSYKVQMRAGDEGANTSITCTTCLHKWIID